MGVLRDGARRLLPSARHPSDAGRHLGRRLVACGGGAAAPETINVGAVVPLTGPLAGGGAQVERGYQMAVEDINAAGGIYVEEFDKQIPIELTLLDDESDPNNTVSHLGSLNCDQ